MPVLSHLRVDRPASSRRWAVSSRFDLQLALTRRSPIGVGFANKPNDGRYFNKRAEMTFECVQRGGALSESTNLLRALRHTQWTTAMLK